MPREGLVTLAHVIYGLHAFSALSGLLSPAMIVTAFLTGWPSIIAVILNYVKRSEVRGTWLDTHYSWQIRTFWFALLWLAIGARAVPHRGGHPGRVRAVVRHRHLGALPHHPRLARALVAEGAAGISYSTLTLSSRTILPQYS